jgi:PEGA domain
VPPIAQKKDKKKKKAAAASARRWTPAAAAVLGAGIVVAVVVGLAMAGRSYYLRATVPGTVIVDSMPPGVEIFLDGKVRGVTPLTMVMKPGTHALELRSGGAIRQFALNVSPGAQLSQHVDWTAVKPVGTLAITTTPGGARVVVDGNNRGVTPLTVADLSAGIHKVVLESSEGTIHRDVKIAAGSQIRLDEAIYPGWIGVFAPFELQIYEGTHLLGSTETARIMLPPGRHKLQLVNTALGYHETHVVDVNPGETAALNVTAVLGIVRVRAPAGAEVWVDGERAGETPMDDLHVPVGTREIVIKHPQLGEQRVTVTVTRSTPADVNADLRIKN